MRSELALFESTPTRYNGYIMSNAIGSSRKSNPCRRICNLRGVPLSLIADMEVGTALQNLRYRNLKQKHTDSDTVFDFETHNSEIAFTLCVVICLSLYINGA